jgi:hypothetical protein
MNEVEKQQLIKNVIEGDLRIIKDLQKKFEENDVTQGGSVVTEISYLYQIKNQCMYLVEHLEQFKVLDNIK